MSILKFLFKNRIKPIAIVQLLLFIPLFLIGFLVFRMKDHVDFFYLGMFQGIFALYWILTAIENFILKKRGFALVVFILAIMFIYFSINSFHTLTIQQ